MRLPHDLNETLRRIRIVNAGAPLTPTTREFLGQLRARYDRLFLKATKKASLYAQDTISRDAPELTRFLRSWHSPDQPSGYVMTVSMPDGSESECVADIDRRFSEYFEDFFTEGDMAADADALNSELEGLCATVSKLPAAASDSLLKTVFVADVFAVLRSMKEHAFDRVRHEYLFAIIGVYGFEPKVLEQFRNIYGNMTSTLAINAVAKGQIRLTRGVPHGCALNAMLFVLCIDPFIRSISAVARIRGLPLPGTETVTVSAYADDVTVFVR
ncbi:hypothetical protein HPB52_023352 [Rhipicephalus sanguineus]|uniref:Reverse transcriptase domain-containing protein n=1 Tax=Rhipicephalus sanguineus TaxID=34632 RepID=A0A9D4QCG4_RHISA|nr:hypothetical protein HPB52_023352 [Rhipicephalus sanguineus]